MLRVDGGADRSSAGLRLLVPYVRGTFRGRKDAVHLLVRRPRTLTPASRTSLVVAHSALALASALPHRGET
jgi:hypothetical protein